MTRAKMVQLIELIHDLVQDGMPWKEKRTKLLDLADGTEVASIEEFAAWFDTDRTP